MDTVAARHTPGPWAVNEDGWKVESEKEHGWINDGWIVCGTYGPDAPANARLISAAPDFYRAAKLRRQYEALPTDRGGSNGPKGRARAAWLAAEEAALAKTEGRPTPTA